jgi:hypothetical protein
LFFFLKKRTGRRSSCTKTLTTMATARLPIAALWRTTCTCFWTGRRPPPPFLGHMCHAAAEQVDRVAKATGGLRLITRRTTASRLPRA